VTLIGYSYPLLSIFLHLGITLWPATYVSKLLTVVSSRSE